MKKFFAFFMAVVFAAAFVPSEASAQNKMLQKERKKQYKVMVKRLSDEGWAPIGTKTLEVCLLEHYDKLADENNQERVAIVDSYKSTGLARTAAITSASLEYSQLASAYLKERIIGDGSIDLSNSDASEEFDRMYRAYEMQVANEMKGQLVESFTIVKNNTGKAKGSKSMQIFFIVNEDQASQARIRAIERAMKESEAAQKHAELIASFVKEGFE